MFNNCPFQNNNNQNGQSFTQSSKKAASIYRKRGASVSVQNHNIRVATDQNQNNQVLYSSLTNAESSNSSRGLDFLSNGFKIRMESGYNLNYSDTQTVYFAFAEHPFVGTSSINPITAR